MNSVRRKTHQVIQVALLGLCLVAGCKEKSPAVPQAALKADAAPAAQSSVHKVATVAVTVNGEPLYQEEIEAAAQRLGVSLEEARNLTVQAEVVAREARIAGFPGASQVGDRFELSRRFLETVYSEETLCSNITSRQIEELYEFSYRPEWPVDVYQGDLIEVRCCQRLDKADCDEAQLQDCLRHHEPLMQLLRPVAEAWRTAELPPLVELRNTWPALAVTDFGVLDWPGIPPDRKRPRYLFPESVVSAVKALAEGEVAGPIRSEIGIHLFKLKRHRGAIESTSPEFRTAARASICKHRIEETRWDYVKRLLEGAVVDVVEAGLHPAR